MNTMEQQDMYARMHTCRKVMESDPSSQQQESSPRKYSVSNIRQQYMDAARRNTEQFKSSDKMHDLPEDHPSVPDLVNYYNSLCGLPMQDISRQPRGSSWMQPGEQGYTDQMNQTSEAYRSPKAATPQQRSPENRQISEMLKNFDDELSINHNIRVSPEPPPPAESCVLQGRRQSDPRWDRGGSTPSKRRQYSPQMQQNETMNQYDEMQNYNESVCRSPTTPQQRSPQNSQTSDMQRNFDEINRSLRVSPQSSPPAQDQDDLDCKVQDIASEDQDDLCSIPLDTTYQDQFSPNRTVIEKNQQDQSCPLPTARPQARQNDGLGGLAYQMDYMRKYPQKFSMPVNSMAQPGLPLTDEERLFLLLVHNRVQDNPHLVNARQPYKSPEKLPATPIMDASKRREGPPSCRRPNRAQTLDYSNEDRRRQSDGSTPLLNPNLSQTFYLRNLDFTDVSPDTPKRREAPPSCRRPNRPQILDYSYEGSPAQPSTSPESISPYNSLYDSQTASTTPPMTPGSPCPYDSMCESIIDYSQMHHMMAGDISTPFMAPNRSQTMYARNLDFSNVSPETPARRGTQPSCNIQNRRKLDFDNKSPVQSYVASPSQYLEGSPRDQASMFERSSLDARRLDYGDITPETPGLRPQQINNGPRARNLDSSYPASMFGRSSLDARGLNFGDISPPTPELRPPRSCNRRPRARNLDSSYQRRGSNVERRKLGYNNEFPNDASDAQDLEGCPRERSSMTDRMFGGNSTIKNDCQYAIASTPQEQTEVIGIRRTDSPQSAYNDSDAYSFRTRMKLANQSLGFANLALLNMQEESGKYAQALAQELLCQVRRM